MEDLLAPLLSKPSTGGPLPTLTLDVHAGVVKLLDAGTNTHSCHHQAPDRLGQGLIASATAEDGTVEAIEDPGRRLVIGVLWHPEEDAEGGAPLFEHLVSSARAHSRVAA